MKKIRKNSRKTAIILLILFISEFLVPIKTFALTGGPSQPEVQSFEPVGTSEMVDLFTGDFNYNIPLLDVGGYPINLAYHAGITMDQEASWVGLGWNINPGVINRSMRGLPDDFSGEEITKEINIKPTISKGVFLKPEAEIFGKGQKPSSITNPNNGITTTTTKNKGNGIKANLGVVYNNYKGIGYVLGLTVSSVDKTTKQLSQTKDCIESVGKSVSSTRNLGDLGINVNSLEGTTFDLNLANRINERNSLPVAFGYNSRSGLKTLSVDWGHNRNDGKKYGFSGGFGSTITFGVQTYTPQITIPINSFNLNFAVNAGQEFTGWDGSITLDGFYAKSYIPEEKQTTSKPAYGYMYSDLKGENDNVLLDFNRERDRGYTRKHKFLPVSNFTYDFYSVSGQGIGGTYRMQRNDYGTIHDDKMSSNSGGVNLKLGFEGATDFKPQGDIGANFSHTSSGRWKSERDQSTVLDFISDNKNATKLNASSSAINSRLSFQSAVFKQMGEMEMVDEGYFKIINTDFPTRVKLTKLYPFIKADLTLEYKNGNAVYNNGAAVKSFSNNVRFIRTNKSNPLSYLTADEASKFGFETEIRNYPLNDFTMTGGTFDYDIIPRTDATNRKPNQISEVTVNSTGGARYIYGIPAYNNKQIERTFNVSQQILPYNKDGIVATSFSSVEPSYATGQVKYTQNTSSSNPYFDDSKNNVRGDDNYYSSITTPGYAHSYLLTHILSEDYEDRTGDGITDDDPGAGIKINYTRTTANYQWRVPYGNLKASFEEGLKSDPNDNKGSYIYGSKENWYIHSIEGKNQVAVFYLELRHDGNGVQNINGGYNYATNNGNNSEKLYSLKKIVLYSKQDLVKNGINNATPIKTVFFEYDYSLCPKTENNDLLPFNNPTFSGKLTLKRVYFTYGKSNKGKLSPYVFHYCMDNYSDKDYNPEYNLKAYDRWGTYKPNLATNAFTGDPNTDPILNSDFPYTDQNKTNSDKNAAVWNLTSIDLPSGGKISVEYESDDYAYVQNMKAMNMMQIVGFSKDPNMAQYSLTNELYDGDISNDYMYFKLEKDKTGSFITDLTKYIPANNKIAYKVLSNIDNSTPGHFEFVEGFLSIEASDRGVNNTDHIGWVRLSKSHLQDRKAVLLEDCNQLAKHIWHFTRQSVPKLMYPFSYSEDNGGVNPKQQGDLARGLTAIGSEVVKMMQGANRYLKEKNYAKKIVLRQSWIRLLTPSQYKYGGGHRVKSIRMNDNWSSMSSENGSVTPGNEDSEYGQIYDYMIEENNQSISSGVASYEPQIGAEENPWHQQVLFKKKNALAADAIDYHVTPYGESFFPSPSVGYRKVVVKNLQHANVIKHATGLTVNEFFTTFDFPTIVKNTEINRLPYIPPLRMSKIISLSEENTTISQGYCIELNDMNGKPKAQWIYGQSTSNNQIDAEKNGLISGVEYKYQQESFSGNQVTDELLDDNFPLAKTSRFKLDNTVTTVDRTGMIKSRKMGIDWDFVNDMREEKSQSFNASFEYDLHALPSTGTPTIIPTIHYKGGAEFTQFQSAVSTKVIQRLGILKEVIAHQEGSVVSTENLLYDDETGEVLLTKTINNFDKPVYAFKYPAHWVDKYEGMDASYKNLQTYLPIISLPNNHSINISGLYPEANPLMPGDECILNCNSPDPLTFPGTIPNGVFPQKVWVYDGGDGRLTGNSNITPLNFIDINGTNIFNKLVSLGISAHDIPILSLNLQVIRSGMRNLPKAPIGSIVTLYNPIVITSASGAPLSGHLELEQKILQASTIEYNDKWSTFCQFSNYIKTCASTGVSEDGAMFQTFLNCLINNNILTTYPNHINFNTLTCNQDVIKRMKEILKKNCSQSNFSNFPINVQNSQGNNSVVPSPNKTTIDLGCCKIELKFETANSNYNINNISSFSNIQAVQPVSTSSANHTFTIQGTIGTDGPVVNLVGSYTCIDFAPCNSSECWNEQDTMLAMNPYVNAVHDKWRAIASYAYQDERVYNSESAKNVRSETDGVFKDYHSFWKDDASSFTKNTTNMDRWVSPSSITKYSPFGVDLENVNALGIFSSALYGYNNSLPIAVAANAKYNEIAYDGFEDYEMYSLFSNCRVGHLNFLDALNPNVSLNTSTKHTGKYSLKVNAGKTATATRYVINIGNDSPLPDTSIEYKLDPRSCIGRFGPKKDGDYLVSTWVHEDNNDKKISKYSGAHVKIEVKYSDNFIQYFDANSVKVGEIIEGWQKEDFSFKINTLNGTRTVSNIKVILVASTSFNSYFDDIRIVPIKGSIQTYSYDAISFKLLAQLDENNYATFYEYDEEGQLVKVKKETIEGIKTVSESRTNVYKGGSK